MSERQPRPETIALHGDRNPRRCDGSPRGPDLPNHVVPIQQHRARGQPVRAQRVREHLHAPHEPHDRRLRAAHRAARRRGGRSGRVERTSRDLARSPQYREGRGRDYLGGQPLWRDLQPLQVHVAAPRCEGALRPVERSGRARQGDHAQGQGRVRRVDRQPEARRGRPRGHLPGGARTRRPLHPRQHGVPLPASPVRSRRRHRGVFGDEVHRGPRDVDRRRHRRSWPVRLDERQVSAHRRSRPELPRLEVHRRAQAPRQHRLHHQGARHSASGPRPRPFSIQLVSSSFRGSRRCRCGSSVIPRTRSQSPSSSSATRRSNGSTTRDSRRAPTMLERGSTCRAGPARSSDSASRAARKRGDGSSTPSSSSRTWRTSATRRRSPSIRRPRPTSSSRRPSSLRRG